MQKILVIRFSSIGDIVLTTPVVRCLKQQLNAEVHFITKESYGGIVKSNPHIDKVYTIEQEINEVLKDLKNEKYDFVVDLHHNLRTTRLKRALKVKSSAFPKLNSQKFLYTRFKWDRMPDIHIVDRYFEAVQTLNVSNDLKGLDYFIPEDDKIDLAKHNIPDDFVAFSIGAQFATKRLPTSKIIEIIASCNKPIVILGGPDDTTASIEIEEACPEVINLVGQINLNQSASIVQQCSKIITHDTGLMHIASAFHKPTISIWGNTTPKLGMYPYQPQHESNYSVHEVALKCRPCSKIGYQKCPKKHFKCMEEQDVLEILNQINA